MSDWCILRTSGRNTLRLATSLRLAGIDAWTPRLRANDDKPAPLMPSFVFARQAYLRRLLEMAATPGKLMDFSVFHHRDMIPLVKDGELERLRQAERKTVTRRKQRTFDRGDRVRVPNGSFGGMIGTVEHSDGKFTEVSFGGSMRVKIGTFILHEDVPREADLAA